MTPQANRAPVDAAARAEPQWLTEEEARGLEGRRQDLLLLPGTLDARLQRDTGLNLFEYLVLSSLSMSEDRSMRMSELAELANGSLSRLSNVAKRLEGRGWMVREPDPENGRYTRARLTDSGWDQVVAAAPTHVEHVRQFVIEPLTAAQQRTLTAIGERIVARIDAEGRCPPSCPPPDC